MRGRYRVGRQLGTDYFSACGEPLGERKHWLEDDYVKFMRFAHWQIELAGAGIVALITNHGYLDNASFRGMRESLLDDFPRITVVDLHGNTRNGERAPHSKLNESVFGIEQGVAVGLFRRPLGKTETIRAHADLWGSAEAKLQALSDSAREPLTWTQLHPAPPYFFLKPTSDDRWHEYQAGHRLCDIMPVNSTAAVTARDSFVIAFDPDELKARLREFANREVSDGEIRQKYFGNTRSTKYRAGDTRGWKVAEARQRLRAEPQWEQHIRPCMYRPFDRREIFWTPWMIDWPRHEVMAHLLSQENLALIARRQMPPAQPCSYFYVSDTIAVDGLIRSDNRGSESVFPLYLDRSGGGLPQQEPNFADAFLRQCEARLGLTCQLNSPTSETRAFTPRELFDYIYALFHCSSYRRRFDELLRIDFPRVLLPREPELFFAMSRCGKRLISAHLLQCTDQRSPWRRSGLAAAPCPMGRGYPRYQDQTIWLNADVGFAQVRLAIWEFRVGTYQVCRKWLKDRRHRELSPRELDQYGQILKAIDETIRLTSNIERLLAQHGGWEQSFGE
jgi:predicted helicase